MIDDACLTEEELYAAADGEQAAARAQTHLKECADCQTQLNRLQAELNSIRRLIQGNLSSDSVSTAETERHNRPVFLNKYFIAGTLFEDDQIVALRGAHSLLKAEVQIFQSRNTAAITDDQREHFFSACQKLSTIRHPAIARLMDAEIEHGQPFVATEYRDGVAIGEYLRNNSLSEQQRVEIATTLANAVAELHRQDITHGAFRMASIVVDRDARPTIIDLGHGELRRIGGPDIESENFQARCVEDVRQLCEVLEQAFARDSIADATAVFGVLFQTVRDPTFAGQQQPAQHMAHLLQSGQSQSAKAAVAASVLLLVAMILAAVWWLWIVLAN